MTTQVSRGQFLKQMGMSTKALMGFYCMGALASCTTDDDPVPAKKDDPSPGGASGIDGTTSGSSINFKLDLTNANFSKLKTDGEFVYAGDVIIANVGNQNYIALSKMCTHQGTSVVFRKGSQDFRCPNHGSEFSSSGAVTKSPAGRSLTVFTTTLSADKNTLTVAA